MTDILTIANQFNICKNNLSVKAHGEGLINDTYTVFVNNSDKPQYILQRINHNIFQNVDQLQDNIEKVTRHIYKKLQASQVDDIDRKVLRFIETGNGKTYYYDGENYWRMMYFIQDSFTYQQVTPESSYIVGKTFGNFESMLADLDAPLAETIPDFHNIEFRLQQLRDAVKEDKAGRVTEVASLLQEIENRSDAMCLGERLYREHKLPKRTCHCDTKVNNMLFDADGNVLCVIDLDTVMPSFIFSDFGDFLRSAANTGAEDDQNLDNVSFNMDIFKSFTRGYLESTQSFLLPVEKENLPYAALLFPYMQTVRFLADYLNGDTYYKIQYPTHNLVRTKAQWKLFTSAESKLDEMKEFLSLF